MKQIIPAVLLAAAALLMSSVAAAQIPAELFAGHQKTSLDFMFFRYIKNKQGQPSKFLFFNRNRSTVDYKMTTTERLPQFGFTEAFSFNHPKLKGFAPVMVVSILNRGVYPKAGVQFAAGKKDYSIFSWVTTETMKRPGIDFFFLGRYTPPLSRKLRLFLQMELVNAFPTYAKNNFTFIQRMRLALKQGVLQWGAGTDLSQSGRTAFTSTINAGGFLRYEF